jgi:aspartate ammonia-lyase
MGAIDAIGVEARHVLLEVMMTVAWADRQLQPEERQAAAAAAMALGLVLPGDRDMISADRRPVPPEELDVAALGRRDREIVYLCAAWMAMADTVEAPEETHVLTRLRTRLGLDEDRARRLERCAVELREAQAISKATWWRSFDKLVVEAARALEKEKGAAG